QFIVQTGVFGGIGRYVEWMNVSGERLLLVCDVRDGGIGRKQACGRGPGISRVSGDQKIAREVQQAEVSPITGVEFLRMEQEIIRGGSCVGFWSEVCDVGNALFFVDDQIFDNR